jgi:hypothetical protein
VPTHRRRRYLRRRKARYRPAGLSFGRTGFAPAGQQTEFHELPHHSLLSDQHRLVADFIFLDAKHILHVCRGYVAYYNGARPSQALHAIPDPYPELSKPPPKTGKLIALPVLGGVQHDYRLAA